MLIDRVGASGGYTLNRQRKLFIMKTTSLIAGVALLIGIVIGIVADPYLPASLNNSQKSYQAGFDAAKTLVEQSSLGNFFKIPADVRTLSGTVTAVNGTTITVHSQTMANPFDVSAAIVDRTVRIAADTKVIALSAKNSKIITSATSSSPYLETVVASSSIHVGDMVTVTAAQNIKALDTFTASEIQILPKMILP